MKLHVPLMLEQNPHVEPVNNIVVPADVKLELPEGCVGLLYAFKSKKAAREWYGKDVRFLSCIELSVNKKRDK